jgi:hypothetical protein
MVGPLLAAVLMPVSSLTVILSSAFTRTFAVARVNSSLFDSDERRIDAAASRAEARSAKAG